MSSSPEAAVTETADLAPALALREAGRYVEAIEWLSKWLEAHPADAPAHALLAQVLLSAEQPARAAEAINTALAIKPDSPTVQRNLARFLLRQQKPKEAYQAARAALVGAPADAENTLMIAATLDAMGAHGPALAAVEDCLAARPDYAEAHTLRAMFRRRNGDLPGALADLQAAVTSKPHLASAWALSASLRRQAQDLPGAMRDLAQAARLEPRKAAHLANLGNYQREAGQANEAVATLTKAVELDPASDAAWTNLGAAFHDLRRVEDAQNAYQRALVLNPQAIEVAHNLGALAMSRADWQGALAHFERALQAEPDNPQYLLSKGLALIRLKRSGGEVEAISSRLRTLRPGDDMGWRLLGRLYSETGRYEEAVAALNQALAVRPDGAGVLVTLGEALRQLGRAHEADAVLARASELDPTDRLALGNRLFMQAYGALSSPQDYLALARTWEHRGAGSDPIQDNRVMRRSPRAGRRLRVGYVSGDFRRHAVSHFVERLFPAHDRARIELFAYFNWTPDEITARLRSSTDHWRPLITMSDHRALQVIEEDQIDVLVDLSGHTSHHRLDLFARRAAPVQAHYLGYCGSTGLSQMDYWIGDDVLTPPQTDHHFSEQVWRLPRVWVSYHDGDDLPTPSWRPAADRAVRIGSFNGLAKVTAETLALWARVMHVLPQARLLLKARELSDPRNRQRILQSLAAHGITEQRIELRPGLSPEDGATHVSHMAYYENLDIAMDPIGATGGGTTTCDALWMGTPVVTLLGDRMGSRMSAALLHGLGRPEWVAASEDEYVAKVAALANDEEGRRHVRATQRSRMKESPLGDSVSLAAALEDAYEAMFDRWASDRAHRPPADVG